MRKFRVRLTAKEWDASIFTEISADSHDGARKLAKLQFHGVEAIEITEIGNPTAFLGQLHNDGLDVLAAKMNPRDLDSSSLRAVYDLGVEFFSGEIEGRGIKFACPSFEQTRNIVNEISSTVRSLNPLGEYLKKRGVAPEKAFREIARVAHEVDGSISPTVLSSRLRVEEQALLRSSEFEDDTRTLMLGMATVMRNSAEYWYEAENDIRNPWHLGMATAAAKDDNDRPKRERREERKEWFVRTLADVAGFGAGFSIFPGNVGAGIFTGWYASVFAV